MMKNYADGYINRSPNPTIMDELRRRARSGQTAHYGDLATIMNIKLGNQDELNWLSEELGVISTDEVKNGRPMLSAIVIKKDDGRPGSGFYILAENLGKFKQGQSKQTFYESERDQVFTYWATH